MEKPVGELISQMKTYLTNISRNLMELSEETDVKLVILKAQDTANGYTGITKVKASNCVQCLNTLWQYYAQLSEVIDKAEELHNKNNFLFNTEHDVRDILNSTSIVIEVERIAINNRNLLSTENKERRVTPQELLKLMQESFENLCRDIQEIVQAAATVVTRLNNMKNEITSLNNRMEKLGICNISNFDVHRIAELESDPLQGVLELDKLVYSIEKYRATIKSIEVEYSQAIKAINLTKVNLNELKDLAEKSRKVIIESQKLFSDTGTVKPIISIAVLESLEDWLTLLQNKLREGQIKAVKVGLTKLQQEIILKLKIERENYYINSKDFNEWSDLKGEFKALLAKIKVLKAKGLININSVDELIKNTRNALYANLIDLDKCRNQIRLLKSSLKG